MLKKKQDNSLSSNRTRFWVFCKRG